jgi:hypothetical protein
MIAFGLVVSSFLLVAIVGMPMGITALPFLISGTM